MPAEFEVFALDTVIHTDIDADPTEPPDPDLLPGPAGSAVLARVRRHPVLARGAPALVMALLAVLTVLGGNRPGPPGPPPVYLPVACTGRDSCLLSSQVRPPLLDSVRAAFPSARVLDMVASRDLVLPGSDFEQVTATTTSGLRLVFTVTRSLGGDQPRPVVRVDWFGRRAVVTQQRSGRLLALLVTGRHALDQDALEAAKSWVQRAPADG